jgi:hypothetical protein
MDADDKLAVFKSKAEMDHERRTAYKGNIALSKVGPDLDATLNFRVNSGLKSEFDKLCRENHTTVAKEIKRFMTAAISSSRLL